MRPDSCRYYGRLWSPSSPASWGEDVHLAAFSDRHWSAVRHRIGWGGQSHRHPHPELLERADGIGAAVLRTDELGTIEVVNDGEQMWWLSIP
ncbi:MAG TPA: hypothetical protein VFI27_09820 [candidate division Zixibacteria bacterium]|nr:hypothetical protein [candidate division Zixibacteria bacterium]